MTVTLASLICIIIIGSYDYYRYQNAPCGHATPLKKIPLHSADLNNALWQLINFNKINHVSLLLTIIEQAESKKLLKTTYDKHAWTMSFSKARFDELPAILRSLARCYGKTTQTAYLVTSGSLEATAKTDPKAVTWRNNWRITCQQYLSKLNAHRFLQIDYYHIQTRYKWHAFYALILISLAFHVPLYQLPFGWALLIFPLSLQFEQKYAYQSIYWLLTCIGILSFGYNWHFALWYNSLLILLCSYSWLLCHFKRRYTTLSITGQQYYQNLQHELSSIKQQNEPCVTYERFDQQSQQLQTSFAQSLKYVTHN